MPEREDEETAKRKKRRKTFRKQVEDEEGNDGQIRTFRLPDGDEDAEND